jgi:type II secretory pathway pseudopilin PulG
MTKSIRNKKFKKGFGLLEVLLAGVIIITVLGALVFLGRNTINNSTYNQQRTEALFLAQQGIEMVRQIRDSNYIDGNQNTNWNNFVSTALTEGDPGPRDPNSTPELERNYKLCRTLSNLTGDGLRRLVLVNGEDPRCSAANGFYTRKIIFHDIGNEIFTKPLGVEVAKSNGYKVEVTVEWIFNGSSKSLTINELIANSRQGW